MIAGHIREGIVSFVLGLIALPVILAICGALAVLGYLLSVFVFGVGG